MTREQALARARELWGPRVSVHQWGDDWWIEIESTAREVVHRLDQHGRVVCPHEACRRKEDQADFFRR